MIKFLSLKIEQCFETTIFLAVQNSSISDIVCRSVGLCQLTIRAYNYYNHYNHYNGKSHEKFHFFGTLPLASNLVIVCVGKQREMILIWKLIQVRMCALNTMHCVLCSCVDIVCGHPQHYIQRCIVETNSHPYLTDAPIAILQFF